MKVCWEVFYMFSFQFCWDEWLKRLQKHMYTLQTFDESEYICVDVLFHFVHAPTMNAAHF